MRADVRLADGMNAYLAADAPAPTGAFMLRDVRAGELVPASAVGGADAVDVQRVTVRADADVDVRAGPGQPRRRLRHARRRPRRATQAAAPTTKVLESAAVAAVLTSSGGFGAGSMTSVQIYVPADKVQPLVEAVDGEAKLTLVPVGRGRSPAAEHDRRPDRPQPPVGVSGGDDARGRLRGVDGDAGAAPTCPSCSPWPRPVSATPRSCPPTCADSTSPS